MKYIITIIASIILLNFSSKAQTKEETINWLQSKMKAYCALKNVSDGSVQYLYNIDGSKVTITETGKDFQQSILFDLNGLSGASDWFYAPDYHSSSIHLFFRSGFVNGWDDSPVNNLWLDIDTNGEVNFKARFLHALAMLIGFNKCQSSKRGLLKVI